MNELAVLDLSAMTMLRVLAWSIVAVVVAYLVAVAIWLVCCGIESGQRGQNLAS